MSTEYKDEVARLNAIKNRIRTNLVAQGITVPEDTMLDAMAEQILSVAGISPKVTLAEFSNSAGSGVNINVNNGDGTGNTLPIYNGKNGTSVAVTSVSESTEDGGSNVVNFSDGTKVTVRNGKAGSPGDPGHTPVRGEDYWTPDDIADIESYIATELAKRGQLQPEFANSIEECTDTSKMYVLPDGYIYAYMLTEVEAGPSYTNVLPLAVQSDGKTLYVGDNGENGYKSNCRVSSSGAEKSATGYYATGFITVKQGDTVRIKGMSGTDGSAYCVAYFGIQAETPWVTISSASPVNALLSLTADANNVRTFSVADANARYMRLTLVGNPDDFVITVNEEIIEGGGTTAGYAWANTGHAFIPADYEDRIVDLENEVSQHKTDIENLKKGITTSTPIKDWDAPIYDAHIPVFELSTEKTAMTNATNTPDNIYAMYDALMAKHPKYITKTDLGLCSDGVNHVYRYDFREPDPHYESGKVWSETKTKAIIVTGIHFEWAGIYSLYYALEEIADNPELRNLRRNTHLIVIPVANPYATIANNYQSGLSTPNSYGVRNANGVEIHRNFEVDWVLTEEGSTHYGGTEPLSEVETQYIDQIMKDNTDAALFLSAHNCGVDTFWGTGFIWSSTATKYMCNMGFRLVDKLSDAWMDKYGDVLSAGIEEYKTELLEDGDTRLGWAGLSTSPGTEAKQATIYGIQGTNIETCNPFQIHGTKENPEPSMSEFTMSRGAEVYVNFLLTAFGVYDPKDKKEYTAAEI